MSNVLTALAPILYGDARLVPRELTGFLGSCDRQFNDQGVALGDVVKVPVSPIMTTAAISPGPYFPTGDSRTLASKTLTLNHTAQVSWHLEAEQERSLENGGVNAISTLAQTINQACRAITNEIEAYLGTVADLNASRAYGIAGTAPFGSSPGIADAAQVRKILVDNGAPAVDPMQTSLIIDTDAGVNLRSLSNLWKVNEAGSPEMLRRGAIGSLFGAGIVETAGVKAHTAGTATNTYQTDVGTTLAVGTTSIPLDTGSGTVLAGDTVTFAGDTNKYVVATGIAAAGTIVLQEPGLRKTLANNVVMTVGAAHASNILMHRSALTAVIRPALQPKGANAEQMVISDPQTGLSFLLLRVVQDSQVSWFVRAVYDAFSANPFAMAKLLG